MRHVSVYMCLYYNGEHLLIADIVFCIHGKCTLCMYTHTSFSSVPTHRMKILLTLSVSLERYELYSHTTVDKYIASSPSRRINNGTKCVMHFWSQVSLPVVKSLWRHVKLQLWLFEPCSLYIYQVYSHECKWLPHAASHHPRRPEYTNYMLVFTSTNASST